MQTQISLCKDDSQTVLAGVFFLAFRRAKMNRTDVRGPLPIPVIEKADELSN